MHVLDGMGGGEGVRHVATLAANSFFETLTGDGAGRRSRDALARSLVAASADANRRIFEVATRDPLMRGTGSTSTCAALVDDALVVAHIGDSRAYLLRGGRLEQVTRDDSLVEAYKDHEPALTAEQVAELPHGVLVKALGLRAAAQPRLSLVPLQRGDVLLLTTDGVHGVLANDAMCAQLAAASGPKDAVHRLGEATLKAGAEDNFTAIVASFDGADLPAQLAPGPWAFPFELPPSSVPDAAAVPLTTRTSPLVHERDKADSGALAIHDAARLPDGRIVVALGEIGVRVLSPAGKTLVHFGEPAHRLVVSEFGDRAIVLASRGEAWRLAKVDLVGKRVRAWRDARFELYAPSFDGARFFCAQDDTVFSVDAVSDGWDAAWSVTVDGGRIVHLELDLSELRIHVYIGDDRVVVWRYELATMILRGKNERPAPVRSHEGGWTTDGEELTIHDAGGIARIRLVLHGATAVRARLRPESFVVWDDRGRLLLLSTSTGRVLRDLRLSP